MYFSHTLASIDVVIALHQWQMLHQIGVFTRAGAFVSLMCACAHNMIVPMLLFTISAVVWCGSWHASDWNSFYCLFVSLQAGIHTNIYTHKSHSSYFVFCPCVCMRLCTYSPFMSVFVCVCSGVLQASWESTATTRTLVTLDTAWMEGTALCPC